MLTSSVSQMCLDPEVLVPDSQLLPGDAGSAGLRQGPGICFTRGPSDFCDGAGLGNSDK